MAYGTAPISAIASVQPIDEERGTVNSKYAVLKPFELLGPRKDLTTSFRYDILYIGTVTSSSMIGGTMYNDLASILDGLLLGDGSIVLHPSGKSAHYTQGCKHKEFIFFVRDILASCGIPFGEKHCKLDYVYENMNNAVANILWSRSHDVLLENRLRWYPNGSKQLPSDFVMSPTSLMLEYLGDGSINKRYDYLEGLSLAMYGYTMDERIVFADLIKSLGIKARADKQGRVHILRTSVKDFYSYIGGCPVTCYDYKFDISQLTGKVFAQVRKKWRKPRNRQSSSEASLQDEERSTTIP